MRVTITVDGVLREIDVRSDLLGPNMGEWQDATEMSLLRAFGSAYKEAVKHAATLASPGETEPADTEPASAAPVETEPAVSETEPAETEPAVSETGPQQQYAPFADNAPVEDFGQAQAYVASEDDAEAFLPEVPSVATEPPTVTICRCGHAVAWHASDVYDVTGPCLMVWPIDEREPEGPVSRCSCLTFEPADVRLAAL